MMILQGILTPFAVISNESKVKRCVCAMRWVNPHCDSELVRFSVDLMQKELEARKSEVKEYEAKVSELHKQAQAKLC